MNFGKRRPIKAFEPQWWYDRYYMLEAMRLAKEEN